MESIKDLAITVMSNCGCSEINDRLVDRTSERISKFVERAEKESYAAGVNSVQSAQPKISKADHLKILMLLSNLETLMLSKNERIHGGLHDDLIECIELLAKTVLGDGVKK